MLRCMRGTIWHTGLLFFLVASCGGGSTPPPAEPTNTVESPTEAPPPEQPADAEPKEDEAPAKKPGSDVPDPEFKEGGSVDDAIKAVPQGTPRLNIETEELS